MIDSRPPRAGLRWVRTRRGRKEEMGFGCMMSRHMRAFTHTSCYLRLQTTTLTPINSNYSPTSHAFILHASPCPLWDVSVSVSVSVWYIDRDSLSALKGWARRFCRIPVDSSSPWKRNPNMVSWKQYCSTDLYTNPSSRVRVISFVVGRFLLQGFQLLMLRHSRFWWWFLQQLSRRSAKSLRRCCQGQNLSHCCRARLVGGVENRLDLGFV